MTWKEFKDEVDLRLEEMGEGQNIELLAIVSVRPDLRMEINRQHNREDDEEVRGLFIY